MSKQGFVYFIAPEAALHRDDSAVVKIGFTRGNPYSRLSSLQTGSPIILKLWAFVDGTEELEKAFHRAFAELHSHGEWFSIEFKLEELLRYMGEEPHTGNHITREQLETILFDTAFSPVVPHPSIPEDAYLRSCDHEQLRPFFPHVWEERFV